MDGNRSQLTKSAIKNIFFIDYVQIERLGGIYMIGRRDARRKT